MGAIAERYRAVRTRVADAADAAGRPVEDIAIIGVTKHVGIEEVRAAIGAGMRDFGENRVQEFEGKFGLFPDVAWHFIGHLQTNKVKDVVGKAALIHSVDSLRLLDAIDRKALEYGVVQPVLIQVNVAAEETKYGLDVDALEEVLMEASSMRGVAVRGLMTMAPFLPPADVRWVFSELREVRDSLSAKSLDRVELVELSMGMTNDYHIAIEEGSTMVRVGTAIFGR